MKNWYVLFTGYENTLVTLKRLVKSCLPKGCGAYAPVTIKGSDERPNRIYNQSLYPFYLFICCTDKSQLKVLLDKMYQLHIEGYFLTTLDGELAQLTSDEIRQIEESKQDEVVNAVKEINGYSSGDRVRVTSGPMKGLVSSVAFVTKDYAFVSMITKKHKPIEVPFLYSTLEKIDVK